MIKIETFVETNHIGRDMWQVEGSVGDWFTVAECPVEDSDRCKIAILRNVIDNLEMHI